MRTHSRLTTYAASAVLAVAGLATLAPLPANAETTTTSWAHFATTFGTKVQGQLTGRRTISSAYSVVGCTREIGRTDANHSAAVALPHDHPMLQVTDQVGRSVTFRRKAAGIEAGTRSTTRVAEIVLGAADGPRLTMKGVRTRSQAWADSRDVLHARTTVAIADMDLTGLPTEVQDGPLGDLVELIDQGGAIAMDELVALLEANGGSITIPGLGDLYPGHERTKVSTRAARAVAAGLRVVLHGQDGTRGGGDDTLVHVAKSRADLYADAPVAVMGGEAYGARAELVGGVASLGRLGRQVLHCAGTDGRTVGTSTATASAPGVLTVAGLAGTAWGDQWADGRARAWTRGSVAELVLGSGDQRLVIRGVSGRALVAQGTDGKIRRRSIKGSTAGSLTFGGTTHALPGPGESMPTLPAELSALVKLEPYVVTRGKRSVRVVALRVTLLHGTAAGSVIDLGQARTWLRRQ